MINQNELRSKEELKVLIKQAIGSQQTLSFIALLEYELEYHKYCKKQKNKQNLLTLRQYKSFRVLNETFTKYS